AVEGIRKTFWRADGSDWPRRLAKLQDSLRGSVPPAAPFDLPVNYMAESELDFAALEKRVDSPSFRTVRWVGRFSTPESSPRNPMWYVAEGISRDGRCFLFVRVEIRHPAVDGLPELDPGPG